MPRLIGLALFRLSRLVVMCGLRCGFDRGNPTVGKMVLAGESRIAYKIRNEGIRVLSGLNH